MEVKVKVKVEEKVEEKNTKLSIEQRAYFEQRAYNSLQHLYLKN